MNESLQGSGMVLIFLGLASNYVFTLVKIFWIAYHSWQKIRQKRKEGSSGKAEVEDLTQEKRGLVFYSEYDFTRVSPNGLQRRTSKKRVVPFDNSITSWRSHSKLSVQKNQNISSLIGGDHNLPEQQLQEDPRRDSNLKRNNSVSEFEFGEKVKKLSKIQHKTENIDNNNSLADSNKDSPQPDEHDLSNFSRVKTKSRDRYSIFPQNNTPKSPFDDIYHKRGVRLNTIKNHHDYPFSLPNLKY